MLPVALSLRIYIPVATKEMLLICCQFLTKIST
jgi:hypothetical protein